MPCKLLYIIQVKRFLKVITSWPYLISKLLVACDHQVCNAASYWPRTFLQPGCFCLAYSILGKFGEFSIMSIWQGKVWQMDRFTHKIIRNYKI